MTNKSYQKQVRLLLSVLPEVAKESCFALHGGTAINLFVRDMPRLSVDIDLTYVPVEDRASSLQHIDEALERTKKRIESVVAGSRVYAGYYLQAILAAKVTMGFTWLKLALRFLWMKLPEKTDLTGNPSGAFPVLFLQSLHHKSK